jgi:hypothetical protein
MNRRDFLQSLAALGAALAIPIDSLAVVPESVIDIAWQSAIENPAFFYVREYGAITTEPFYDPLPDPDDDDEGFYVENSGQQQALEFFRDDFEYNDLLGIRVVQGCCPGSDYYAAELKGSINDANSLAERNGIPIRFAWLGF